MNPIKMVGEKMKQAVRNWLQIQPSRPNRITIQEPLSFQSTVIRNQIWYRGDAAELEQLYKQIGTNDPTNAARFWAAVPSNDFKIRKIHCGLPAIMVDTIAYIVKSDMDDVTFDGPGGETWDEIIESGRLDFPKIVGNGVVGACRSGDGAWKISVDTDASKYPIVEFVEADKVDYVTSHGYITGFDFWTDHACKDKIYRLKEMYRKGSVSYALYDDDTEIPLNSVPELADLEPVSFNGDFVMAVPFCVYDSPKFKGRGKAIYESKLDDFDALDEVISQWWDAIRAGRVKKYIPDNLIPTNPNNGAKMLPNDFGSEYIVTESDNRENAVNKIEMIQPDIKYDAFLASYTAALDMCLQGIMSPATLGIDVGKMASADAQREKKDITGFTRNTITGVLEKTLPELVKTILMTYDTMQRRNPGVYKPTIGFGEYGAPSFDSRVETIGRASAANTMSIETQVDELWGNSKDDDWKKEEVAKIKALRGIELMDEPSISDSLEDVPELGE